MSQQSLLDGGGGRGIVEVDIADRMERAFLDYSMSVIVGRALPDARDGLKPVQRRILHAMNEAGLRPGRPYRKSAFAVGDVMKRYHPHGDASIYEALVRMAQDFSTRKPLIDGHGNFGSVDGDPPAAMRYTEARLSAIAMELLDGVDENTVDFAPNYDGDEQEPVVLPARFPNLLVNGASGIAVGMATNIPPHNLGETVGACRHLLARPQATVDQLMTFVPAPDFPTGARILDGPGIRDAYLTGRGAITMEAVATTETRSGGLPRIVVTELPYQVNKALLLERIADLVKARKLEAIRDLRDESSRDGMRVVIELKRGEDPSAVLTTLLRLTDLRTTFHVNMVALVDGQPRTLGLVEALTAYLAHQRTVLTRRSRFRREKAAARAHVLEGLLTALDAIDEVIALIRAAATPEDARSALMTRFDLTEVQATAILDMQLRRLAALERDRLATELAELRVLIAELDRVLGDPAALDALLDEELAAVAQRHPSPRRSRLVGQETVEPTTGAPPPVTLEAQPVLVTVSAGAYLRAVPQRRTSGAHTGGKDPLVTALRTSVDTTLLLVDADGDGNRIAVADLPVVTPRQRGVNLGQLTGMPPEAAIAGGIVLGGDFVVTVSAAGLVKRTPREEYEGRTRAMVAAGVRPSDRIVALAACGEEDHLLLAHDRGLVIRFPVAEVRPMGRAAAGVAGMSLPRGGRIAALSVVPGGIERVEGPPSPQGEEADISVLTLAGDGAAKRAPLADYPLQGRGGKGVLTGASPLAWCGLATDLHVPTGLGWTLVRAELVPTGKRTGAGSSMTEAVTGQVVPES